MYDKHISSAIKSRNGHQLFDLSMKNCNNHSLMPKGNELSLTGISGVGKQELLTAIKKNKTATANQQIMWVY
jgi:DNA replication protein DnaC